MTTVNVWGSDDPVNEEKGGTAQNAYASGDILYASGVDTLARRAKGSDGEVLTVTGGVPVWAAASSGVGLNLASGTLTATQLKAINSSPPTILAAPGSGKINFVLHCMIRLNVGSEVFTGTSDLGPVYSGTTRRLVEAVDADCVTAAVDSTHGSAGNQQGLTTVVNVSSATNAALQMWAGSDFGGNASNDGTLDWWLVYITEDIT